MAFQFHRRFKDTKAFRAADYQTKYPVTVRAQEPTLDLAILDIEVDAPMLEAGSADEIHQMDHLVIAGFPNYRLGDTGTIVPGFVVGFRSVSGVQRILTNAPIVRGGSGSPVLNGNGSASVLVFSALAGKEA